MLNKKSLALVMFTSAVAGASFSSAYAENVATSAAPAAQAQVQANAAAPAAQAQVQANAAAPAAQAQVQANAAAPAAQAQVQANAAAPAAKAQASTVASAVDTGVGIQLVVENGVLRVVNPVKAAAKAGVKSGDVIAKINQESVKNMTLAQAVELINGKSNSEEKVNLTVIRKGKPVQVSLVRENAKNAQSGKSA